VIVSFRDRETERIWTGEGSRRLPPWIHAIRVNDQWRICFRWTERGAQDVEIVDYHS